LLCRWVGVTRSFVVCGCKFGVALVTLVRAHAKVIVSGFPLGFGLRDSNAGVVCVVWESGSILYP
jgi:hypothetical protein